LCVPWLAGCLRGPRIAQQLRVFGPKARGQSTDRRGACVACTRPVMKKIPTTPPATRPSAGAAQHPGENGAGAGAASAAQTGVVAVTCECGRQFASGRALGGHRKRCNNGVQSPPAAESAHGAGKHKQMPRNTSAKEAGAAANAKARGGAHTTSVRAGSLGSPRIAHLASPPLAICIPAASLDLALASIGQQWVKCAVRELPIGNANHANRARDASDGHVHNGAVQCSAVQCSAVQCSAVQCDASMRCYVRCDVVR
jgi:hypothetical protein